MSEKPGFLIYKKHYPMPERFRLEDPVLVRLVTGMEWPAFTTAMEEMDPEEPDQVALAGLVAVAFWQGNPNMRRDKVQRIMEQLPLEDIEMVGDDDVEDDAGPPDEAGPSSDAPTIRSVSSAEEPGKTTEASDSDGTQQSPSGEPGSDIISQDSHQAA